MVRYAALAGTIVVLALAAPGKPVAPTGNWHVDSRHSDVQLITDGTTNFGKAKTEFTVGFARATGIVKLDGTDPTKSEVHIDFYPATAMEPTVDHDGKVNREWFADRANNMMICFHSSSTALTSNGRLEAKGLLGMIRVDRNVELTASEAYAGPVYGPPILHHVTHEVTFVFDLPSAGGSGKADPVRMKGSTKLAQEDFPQFFRAVIATSWPAVVQDRNCRASGTGEAYGGEVCTGTFMVPSFPTGPGTTASEAFPGPRDFNTITGQHMTIAAHLRLKPAGSGAQASGGN